MEWAKMLRIAIILLFALLSLPTYAEVPLTGTFTATQSCPAYQSINRETNPGNVTTSPGTAYTLVAGKRQPPTHFSIVIPNAKPERRWVAATCGTTDAAAQASEPTAPAYRGTQYVLAVNWQPAFCELSPRKAECRDQRANSFEASNFTLHGLWPQPRSNEYCDVSPRDRFASEDGRWRDLPQLDLPLSLRRELDQVMPGSQSALDRYEWTKHGTCYGTDARTYYADALDLLEALNTSQVADLFAGNIGKRITLAQIRDAFDAAFGPGAGQRVEVSCTEDGNRILITELTINLTGDIDGPNFLATLIAAASPADGGCRSGQVDAVGLR